MEEYTESEKRYSEAQQEYENIRQRINSSEFKLLSIREQHLTKKKLDKLSEYKAILLEFILLDRSHTHLSN